jgi:hypothetical protein
MRWSSYRLRAGAIASPKMEGFFLHHSALSEHEAGWEWQCPWCGHSVLFSGGDRAVAENAARGHVLSRHGIKLWSDVMGALEVLRASTGRD